MKPEVFLLAAALAAPSFAQGSIVILDARPSPDSLLHQDLQALLGEDDPLIIQLVSEGSSDLAREDRVVLAREDLESADSRALAERVRSASAVVLEDGSLLGWYKTLHRARRTTRLVHALLRHTREGRTLVGIGGAGAALAGAGIVETASLEEVPRNPRRAYEFEARVTLGWGPPALVDARAWGGDTLRTLRLMERSHMNHAAHLGAGSGLVLESRHSRVRVIGEGGVIFFETGPGHRNRHDLRGGRVSLLVRGDIWDLPHRRLVPAPDAPASPMPEGAFSDLLVTFAADPTEEAALESPWGNFFLRRRPDTRILGAGDLLRPMRAEFDLMDSP